MYEYRDDERHLFDMVEKKIAHNGRKLIHSLNDNWRLLGVDDPTREKRTEALVKIVQERYDEVLEETLDKIKVIKVEIENLKKEALHLGERLSINIETSTIKKDAPLMAIKEALENDLERYRKMISSREEHLTRLNSWQSKLSHMLGCPARELASSPLPSEEALQDLADYLRDQEAEYERRMQVFLKKQEDIKRLIDDLEEEPQDSFQYYIIKSSYMDFRVTDQNMAKLDVVNENLLHQFQQKEAKVLEMRERLTVLWERLEESPEYRMTFLAKHPGHSRSAQAALEVELQRCEEKKRQSFKLFVSKIRSEIVELWDHCLYSELQREKFVEFYSNVFNEDLLMLHEIYLDELKVFYKDNKDIFDMYTVRQQLWKKWSELESRANEPGRFHNRGGQLLREEKERKTVSNQLPKIESELTQLVELYESRTGKVFTVNGQSLLMCMQNDWNQKNLERNNKLSARKQLPSTSCMSAPRSAPAPRHVANFSSRAAMTAVKRRLSPRQSPQVVKSRLLPRRLVLSPSRAQGSPAAPTPAPSSQTPRKVKRTSQEETPTKKFKGPLPTIAINGYLLKKKIVGRRSGESKAKRRSRKSRGDKSANSDKEKEKEQVLPESTLSSYIDFQEHLNDNSASRSSIVPMRTLRSRMFNPQASSSVYMPDGQVTPIKETFPSNNRKKQDTKENQLPYMTPSKLTPNAHLYASNTFGATPMANRCKPSHNTDAKTPNSKKGSNIDLFATPRPVTKATKNGLLYRQNTVTLASGSERPRPMLRSSSSHNLRANSPSFAHHSSKLQLASKLPLII